VHKINHVVNTATRTAVVEIDLPGAADNKYELLPGMSADVSVVLEP